jgi:mycothiol synthase
MTFTVRPFTPDDYPAIVAVGARAIPDYNTSADEMRFSDERREPHYRWHRFVAERDGQIVGASVYGQFEDMYHPQTFWGNIYVDPAYQGRGIGAALYMEVLNGIAPYEPRSLRIEAREDQPRSLRFLADRGFREEFRVWESVLNVAAFDPAPFADHLARVQAQNIAIKPIAALADDPERDHKLHDVFNAVSADEPRPEPFTPISFEHFAERQLRDPNLLPEGYFIALHNGAYVGMTELWRVPGGPELRTGLTGVRRAYRRRGIALALKLHAIRYAQQQGVADIRTFNESTNRPMLAINERLGFRKQPAWIVLQKQFS